MFTHYVRCNCVIIYCVKDFAIYCLSNSNTWTWFLFSNLLQLTGGSVPFDRRFLVCYCCHFFRFAWCGCLSRSCVGVWCNFDAVVTGLMLLQKVLGDVRPCRDIPLSVEFLLWLRMFWCLVFDFKSWPFCSMKYGERVQNPTLVGRFYESLI